VLRYLSLYASLVITSACAHVQSEGSPVVAGLNVRIRQAARPDTVVYQRSVSRNGAVTDAGTRTVVLRGLDAESGERLLEVEQRFPAGNGEIVDTAVSDLHTLRAVAHRSHQPTKTMRFNFADSSADGTVSSIGAAHDSTISVRQSIGGPIFDSNVIDLVVAAMPLREGFTTQAPFFIYEQGGRVMMPVTVRERVSTPFAKLGQREVWVVDVGVPGVPATFWIDTKTHAVLRVRYDVASRKTSFTDERITPL
jgi:hypothetical protein